jgi:hypothetical protein
MVFVVFVVAFGGGSGETRPPPTGWLLLSFAVFVVVAILCGCYHVSGLWWSLVVLSGFQLCN